MPFRRRSTTARHRRRGAAPAGVVALALLVAACGGSPPAASVDPGPRPDLPAAEGSVFLPPVTVWDVGEKEWVQLADYLPAERPVLVWFWAPH